MAPRPRVGPAWLDVPAPASVRRPDCSPQAPERQRGVTPTGVRRPLTRRERPPGWAGGRGSVALCSRGFEPRCPQQPALDMSGPSSRSPTGVQGHRSRVCTEPRVEQGASISISTPACL